MENRFKTTSPIPGIPEKHVPPHPDYGIQARGLIQKYPAPIWMIDLIQHLVGLGDFYNALSYLNNFFGVLLFQLRRL